MSNEKTNKENIVSVDANKYPDIAKSIPREMQVADANAKTIRIDQHLNSKDYLVTMITSPDYVMSSNDLDRQVLPRRTYEIVSLYELPTLILSLNKPIWEHPNLKEDLSNEKDIPFKEKKWGIKSYMTIEPFTEELEKQYVQSSKDGFFKSWREVQIESGDFINKRTYHQDSYSAESEEL